MSRPLLTDCLWCRLHVFSATAAVPSTLYYIQRSAAIKVLYQYPRVQASSRKMILQKLTRWQNLTEQVLKDSGSMSRSVDVEAEKSQHEYAPRGALPLPEFSTAGQLVDDASKPPSVDMVSEDDSAEKAASVSSEGDDPHKGALGDLASVKEDVKRLEGKVDKLLDLILRT